MKFIHKYPKDPGFYWACFLCCIEKEDGSYDYDHYDGVFVCEVSYRADGSYCCSPVAGRNGNLNLGEFAFCHDPISPVPPATGRVEN